MAISGIAAPSIWFIKTSAQMSLCHCRELEAAPRARVPAQLSPVQEKDVLRVGRVASLATVKDYWEQPYCRAQALEEAS